MTERFDVRGRDIGILFGVEFPIEQPAAHRSMCPSPRLEATPDIAADETNREPQNQSGEAVSQIEKEGRKIVAGEDPALNGGEHALKLRELGLRDTFGLCRRQNLGRRSRLANSCLELKAVSLSRDRQLAKSFQLSVDLLYRQSHETVTR